DAHDLPVVDEPRWTCSGVPPFDAADQIRNVVGLAAAPDVRVGELSHLLPTLLAHGVYEIVFMARSPPMRGSYGARARWSGAGVFLDRPPAGSRLILADANGWQDLVPTPWFQPDQAVCALLVDPAMTVATLQRRIGELSSIGGDGPCEDALYLVLQPDRAETGPAADEAGCAALPSQSGPG
ncbi:MAG: hypothetical protein D6798_08215, partial [Deltaproteobacteria bacterium]